MSDVHEQQVEENAKSSYLPVALFFVSVVALAKAWMESASDGPRVLTSLVGPAATVMTLLAMSAIGAVWFLRGGIHGPFRKILALALFALPLAGLLGTIQGPTTAPPVGGSAGVHLATVFLTLPPVVASGIAGLLLLINCDLCPLD